MNPTDHTWLNQATYDRIAPLYRNRQLELSVSGAGPFGELEQRWIEQLPEGARVGDLGCGPALDGARFAGRGLRVVGIDLSREMLSSGEPGLEGGLVQADLRALPLRSASLDGAWCAASLLHVPEPDTELALAGILSALRLSGVLALVTALGDGSQFETVPYAPDELRWYVYRDRSRLERQIEDVGFRLLWSGQVDGSRSWLTVLAQADQSLERGLPDSTSASFDEDRT